MISTVDSISLTDIMESVGFGWVLHSASFLRGTPAPEGRHRAVVGKNGKIRTYPDQSPNKLEWKSAIKNHFSEMARVFPAITGRIVRMDLLVLKKRPAKMHQLVEKTFGGKLLIPDCIVPNPGRPDKDNYAKAVFDAAQKSGLIHDDAVVVSGDVSKGFHSVGGDPGMYISIYTLERKSETVGLTLYPNGNTGEQQ
jgi:Holliday junction resolvase RusA-like endonuclease